MIAESLTSQGQCEYHVTGTLEYAPPISGHTYWINSAKEPFRALTGLNELGTGPSEVDRTVADLANDAGRHKHQNVPEVKNNVQDKKTPNLGKRQLPGQPMDPKLNKNLISQKQRIRDPHDPNGHHKIQHEFRVTPDQWRPKYDPNT